MSKKQAGKVIQMLSPENYIRKKARSLPIHECLVNTDWQKQGFANIIVARSHTNGNITACMYLVDLYCLGIKDTHYVFNISKSEYTEKLGIEEDDFYMLVDYTLVHNIVFAALEFADEYEFKPHKDYSSTTRFMLEEDTEDIELMEIECGKNDKPFFVSGPYDDQAKINKILAQLERTAGAGNFEFIIGDDDDDDSGDENFEEKRDKFMDLYSRREDLDDDEFEEFDELIADYFSKITDPDVVDQICEEYLNDFDFELTDETPTAEMLGITGQLPEEEIGQLFIEIYSLAEEEQAKAAELLKKFIKLTPENPAAKFLELILLKDDSEKYTKKLKGYYKQYPNFPLLRILMFSSQITDSSNDLEELLEKHTMQSMFAGRKEIHNMEAFNFVTTLLLGVYISGNLDRLEGLYEAYMNLEFTDLEFEMLEHLLFTIKSNSLFGLFSPEID